MSHPDLDKAALRTRLRAELAAVSAEEWRTASVALCGVVSQSPQFAAARSILAFVPIEREVDITPLLQRALAEEKTLCLPRIDWSTRTMVPAIVTSLEPEAKQLETTRHAIRQPTPDRPAFAADRLDLILVPALAFSRWPEKGGFARLGRGAGFYDRFLTDLGTTTRTSLTPGLTLGVALNRQILPRVPVDAWDIAIHAVATPEGLVAGV